MSARYLLATFTASGIDRECHMPPFRKPSPSHRQAASTQKVELNPRDRTAVAFRVIAVAPQHLVAPTVYPMDGSLGRRG